MREKITSVFGHFRLSSTLLVFILLFSLSQNAFCYKDDSWKIATSRNIPGKFGWTTCNAFAQALYQRLTRAGGEAHLIIFRWKQSGKTGRHAMVAFRDAKGRYWGMDNRCRRPIRLNGGSPGRWSRSFAKGYSVKLVSAKTERRLKGQFASLNRRATPSISSSVQLAAKKAPKRSAAPVLVAKKSKPSVVLASNNSRSAKKAKPVLPVARVEEKRVVPKTPSFAAKKFALLWKPSWNAFPSKLLGYRDNKWVFDSFSSMGERRMLSRMQLPLRWKGPYLLASTEDSFNWWSQHTFLSASLIPGITASAKPNNENGV